MDMKPVYDLTQRQLMRGLVEELKAGMAGPVELLGNRLTCQFLSNGKKIGEAIELAPAVPGKRIRVNSVDPLEVEYVEE